MQLKHNNKNRLIGKGQEKIKCENANQKKTRVPTLK